MAKLILTRMHQDMHPDSIRIYLNDEFLCEILDDEVHFVDIPEGIHKLRVRHSKLVSATRIFEARNNSEKVIEIHTSKFKNYFAASIFGFGSLLLYYLNKELKILSMMQYVSVFVCIYVIYIITVESKKMLKIIEVDL